MICIYFVVLVRQPLGHPQKASLGHHFEVRPYTSFLKKKYHFGVDHFQVPPRHLQRFLKFFFWGGGPCVRTDLTVSCEDPDWTDLRTPSGLPTAENFILGWGPVCICPELTGL